MIKLAKSLLCASPNCYFLRAYSVNQMQLYYIRQRTADPFSWLYGTSSHGEINFIRHATELMYSHVL